MRQNRERRQRLGRSCRSGGDREGSPHPATGTIAGARSAGDRNLKKRRGGVSCGAVHSQAREMLTQGYTATLVAATLAISRSSLYYQKRPRGSRADRTYDEQIVMACGEKQGAYGYRRVAWWLQRKKGLLVNPQACVAGDARTWVAGALSTSSTSTTEERVGPRGEQPSRIKSGRRT